MAILDKLMFWKKKEPDFNIAAGPDLGFDLNDPNFGMPPMPDAGMPNNNLGLPQGNDFGFQPEQQRADFGFAKPSDLQKEEIPQAVRNAPSFGGAFAPQQMPQQQFASSQPSPQDIQILNSKLETVKAVLESIDQRLKNIERMEESREREKGRW